MRKKHNEASNMISDEKEYQTVLQWLKDHVYIIEIKSKTQYQDLLMNLSQIDWYPWSHQIVISMVMNSVVLWQYYLGLKRHLNRTTISSITIS
jgi:hypothetical protein